MKYHGTQNFSLNYEPNNCIVCWFRLGDFSINESFRFITVGIIAPEP